MEGNMCGVCQGAKVLVFAKNISDWYSGVKYNWAMHPLQRHGPGAGGGWRCH